MKILVVCATGPEMRSVKKQIQTLKIPHLEVDFLTCGIGTYASIYILSTYLAGHTVDVVINIGICGYKDNHNGWFQVARSYNLQTHKELLIPIQSTVGTLSSIACSDIAITESDLLGDENFVDMESWGIEYVCAATKIARYIIKAPYDRIGHETKNMDYDDACASLDTIPYKDILLQIISTHS